MKKATMIVRYLLGLIFVVFGLNGFFHFMPEPAVQPPAIMVFFQAISSTGLIYVVKALEVLSGAMLLANFYPALAIAFLAPIVANIFLFHATLHREALPIAIVLVAGVGYMIFFGYRKAFAGLLNKKL